MGLFVPARRRGHEILDGADVRTADRVRSIGDVARSNTLFGGRRAVVRAIGGRVSRGDRVILLDVGTGLADIPAAVKDSATEKGALVYTIGLDEAVDLLGAAQDRLDAAVCGNARTLPFADHSVDIVICSQLLHHFADAELATIIRELNRVASRQVVIADIRRSWLAVLGFWLVSFPLRFHRITRHDGVVSIFRGFTAAELEEAIHQATGIAPRVRRAPGWRLVASWSPVV